MYPYVCVGYMLVIISHWHTKPLYNIDSMQNKQKLCLASYYNSPRPSIILM